MSFNGTEGSKITLSEGSAMTASYRTSNPNGLKGHFYGKDLINDILEQSGCKGIRIYYGEDNGVQKLVLVGADSNENDLTRGDIVDSGIPCPTRCGQANRLNS